MLRALPKGEPFVYFDTDTLITGDIASVPFNFDPPSASLRREGTLPDGLLDGSISCHYRLLPMLYAREHDHVVQVLKDVTAPNKLKKVLKTSDTPKRMIYQGRGHKVRALFDRDNLLKREQAIRNRIKSNGFWMR